METVHAAQGQGVVRGHHGEINGVGLGKVHNFFEVLGPGLRDAHRVRGNAAIAGESVDGLHLGILFQFFDDSVLAASAADD